MERLSRRSFMKIAGAATGAAALAAAPPIARAAVGEEGAERTDPTADVPEEPLVAYVRDATARRGDRHLRHRRAHVPRPRTRAAAAARGRQEGSELDVLPPRSSGDQPGPGRRQRRHLRVRQPGRPDTVTIITNYVPLQGPPGGPNFFEFGDDVLYSIYIDNDGDALPEITYQFQFNTKLQNPNTFLYNTGPIGSLDRPELEQAPVLLRLTSSTRTGNGQTTSGTAGGEVLGENLACPPCNIGPRSTPNYDALAAAAVHHSPRGETVFAGQRNDGFFVDLGAIFDLGDIRPFQNLHLIPSAAAPSVDPLKTLNIHTIAIKVPISMLTQGRLRCRAIRRAPTSVLGIWGGASRRKVQVRDDNGNGAKGSGPWVQVSRLGNPLFNEVIVPLGEKDRWNAVDPIDDTGFAKYVKQPELARLLPVLYPGVFPNLAAYTADRADLARDPAHGHPERRRPGVPELHRAEAGGHAAAERRDPADDLEPEPPRPGRRRRSPASRTGGACSTTSSRSS